jgi:hypothetical protein
MIEARKAQEQVELFLDSTMDARELSEKCRDYMDHKQWTDAEVAKLKSRNQAAIVVNRVRPKIKGLVGLYNLRHTDPKAFPRTKKHEKASHAITDALRYVADKVDFQTIKIDVAEDFFVEGYGGASVEVKDHNGEKNITVNRIPWDRIYFDPHSRKHDFSDCRFKGYYLWLYREEAKELFPEADIDDLMSADFTDETTEDRPRWLDRDNDRIRIAAHYFKHKGKWHYGILSYNTWFLDPQESPYLDDDSEPTCPIELVSANMDRDNNRYGEVAGFLDQQDEINHRRSKWLFMNSSRQTFGRRGSVKDVSSLKRELSKPDGHVEFDGERFGQDFGIIPNGDQSDAQIALYQDAKGELDAISYNAQLAGDRQSGDLSGIAIERLQAAGTIELNSDFNKLAGWEKRIYAQIWARVKQFWTEEKWIRVTDDQDNLRWVGLNGELSAGQFLEEIINDESEKLGKRKEAAAAYMFLQQNNPEGLEIPVGVSNPTAELDVDIIIDQSFDVINVQDEQFRLLAQFAQGADIDIIELIQLSQIRGKDELIEKIEQRRQSASEGQSMEQQAAQAALELERKVKAEELNLKSQEVQIKQFDAETKRMAVTKETPTVSVRPDNSQADKLNFDREKLAAEIALKREEIAANAKLAILKMTATQKPVDRSPSVNVYDKDAMGMMQEAINVMGQSVAASNQSILASSQSIKSSQSEVAGAIKELASAMQKPKQIKRDKSGQVVGIQ